MYEAIFCEQYNRMVFYWCFSKLYVFIIWNLYFFYIVSKSILTLVLLKSWKERNVETKITKKSKFWFKKKHQHSIHSFISLSRKKIASYTNNILEWCIVDIFQNYTSSLSEILFFSFSSVLPNEILDLLITIKD